MSSIEQGLVLMLVGVSVVFIFLVLLVFIIKIMSFIVLRFFPEKEEPPKKPSGGAGNRDAEIAAAIAAATAYSKQ